MVLVAAVRWGVKKKKAKGCGVESRRRKQNCELLFLVYPLRIGSCCVSNKTWPDPDAGSIRAERNRRFGWMSVYIQSGAFSLPAEKMMLIYNLHSCGGPAEAMSLPIFAGKTSTRHKKKQIDRPNCDFGWVRRFNPPALC